MQGGVKRKFKRMVLLDAQCTKKTGRRCPVSITAQSSLKPPLVVKPNNRPNYQRNI